MSTYEKELMVLVVAIKHWCHYLLGRKLTVRTDHKSLKYLWEQQLTTEAQHRWLVKLMGFTFNIEYK